MPATAPSRPSRSLLTLAQSVAVQRFLQTVLTAVTNIPGGPYHEYHDGYDDARVAELMSTDFRCTQQNVARVRTELFGPFPPARKVDKGASLATRLARIETALVALAEESTIDTSERIREVLGMSQAEWATRLRILNDDKAV